MYTGTIVPGGRLSETPQSNYTSVDADVRFIALSECFEGTIKSSSTHNVSQWPSVTLRALFRRCVKVTACNKKCSQSINQTDHPRVLYTAVALTLSLT